VKERKPRIIANPVTKEPMKIYPKKTVKFRESKKINKG
ncbi:HU family DNA-binding protein, partial [uncultured Fusobacterium sp.]